MPSKRYLRNLGYFIGLVSLGLVLVAMLEFDASEPFVAIPKQHGEPDYYIEGAELRRFDATGKLEQILTSPEVAHYPEDNSSYFQQPFLVHYTQAGEIWHLSSDKAKYTEDDEHIFLEDAVKLSPQNPTSSFQPDFLTQRLWINNLNKQAFTSDPVDFVSPSGITQGVGFNLDLETGTAIIKQAVTGQYLVPQKKSVPQEDAN